MRGLPSAKYVSLSHPARQRHWQFTLVNTITIAGMFGILVGANSAPILAADPSNDVYRLTAGDRVTITVAGQPDLSGEFPLDAAGNILLPLIGAIPVGDMTLEQSRNAITTRLADGFLRNPVVTIKPLEYRPIYIFGDVKTAGSYPFRYGTMVLSAVALAGGFGTQNLLPNAGADYLTAAENVRTLADNRRTLLVRQARLEAQAAGQSEFRVELADASDEASREVRDVYATELQQLRIQKRALDEELRLLGQQKPRLDSEMTGVKEQIAGEKRQYEIVSKQIADYAKLTASGFGRRPVLTALQREQVRLDGSVSKFTSDLARLELQKGEIDIKLNDARQAYERRILVELQDVQAKLREADASLPGAMDLRDVRQQQSTGTSATLNGASPTHLFYVSRKSSQELLRREVKDGTLLLPGDIVEVVRVTPRRGAGRLTDLAPAADTRAAAPASGAKPTRTVGPLN
jgi:polysaccharide biosynthesis/export protein